MVFRKV